MEFLKRYWYFLFVIIVVFAIQIYFYCSTFSTENGFSLFFWNNFEQKVNGDTDIEGKWGAFGDYMGGVLNPILGFITIVLLLISHYRDSEKDEDYRKQREIDLILMRIHKLIDNHNKCVDSFEIFNKNNEVVHSGKFVFTRIFNMIKIVNTHLKYLHSKGLTDKDILIVSYILIYFGNHDRFVEFLNTNYPTINYERDLEKKIDKINDVLTDKYNLRLFNGFNTIFGTYFRGIYHIVDTINSCNLISDQFKYELVKDIRSQMSNQEQSLLLINSMSTRGRKWVEKDLIIKYKLCRNIERGISFNGYKLEKYIYEVINSDVC